MSERSALHATFTLERDYLVPPERTFAAWADPVSKSRWFAGVDSGHTLDFRVGGQEVTRGTGPDGWELTYTSTFHEILPDTRIVYSSTLYGGTSLATVSLTTVEFHATDEGTRLVLTEQGSYLDAHEDPYWRERGTADQLAALATTLLRPDEE
ncbi:SRPBCC domain-containing protein [Streptomyces xiaopingdaonensis]|uniref:SRPBCC domain-containing protein n=1 Tax=Streptomyces xiaopingdaonensis TaxID=1565415 RepID=UPI0002D733ED|nr:SRPBCC domain-containing protein [Streptomyces xiaopingdaonensis]